MKSDDLAHQIVLRTVLLLGAIPEVGEKMTESAWKISEKLADLMVEWRQARQAEGRV